MAVTRDVRYRRQLRAWYGTRDDVRSLARFVEDAFKQERDQAHDAIEQQDDGPLKDHERGVHARAWHPSAMIRESDGAFSSGPLDELLDSVPRGRTRTIFYDYPQSGRTGEHVQLTFGDGLSLTVEGQDEVRVRSLTTLVSDRAAMHTPWWTWLTATFRGFLTVYVLAVVFLQGLGYGLLRHVSHSTSYAWAPSIGGTVIASAIAFALTTDLLAPKFELLPSDGAAPKAQRLLFALGALAGSALVGGVVSLAIG